MYHGRFVGQLGDGFDRPNMYHHHFFGQGRLLGQLILKHHCLGKRR